MAVPYTFGSATTAIPLSQLDSNFATAITLGNASLYLGNTTTSVGNLTLANVTISNVATTFPNSFLSNSAVTIGNTSVSLGSTQTTFGNVVLQNANITSVAATFPNSYLANSTATLGNATITLGSTTTSVGNLTLNNVTISGGTENGVSYTNVSITSGNITGTVSNATSDSVNVVGFMGIPQNSQNGNYGLVLADAGKHIYHPSGQAAATYTIPANSNIAYTVGTSITFINGSANNVSIAITTDTMTLANSATTGTRTLTANGVATCVKVTSTSWLISGAGLS